jgi:hypothetical protein
MRPQGPGAIIKAKEFAMSLPIDRRSGPAEPSRTQLLLLAAALAGTMLTGGAAIAGLTRTPSVAPTGPAAGQVQTVPPASTTPRNVEPGG